MNNLKISLRKVNRRKVRKNMSLIVCGCLILSMTFNMLMYSATEWRPTARGISMSTKAMYVKPVEPTMSPEERESLRESFTHKIKPNLTNPLNIFYFGVTHNTSRDKMIACHKTWVQTLPNMHWYSNTPDPEVNVTVVSNNGNDGYNDIAYRTLLIYKHVYENHKGYDWYVRFWDDTYIFRDRLERLLRTQNSKFPLLIGELRRRYVRTKADIELYIGGGSGWVMSFTALNIWFDSVNNGTAKHLACKNETIDEYFKNVPADLKFAEDIHLGQCLLSLGVHSVHVFGFHMGIPPPKDYQAIVDGHAYKQQLGQIGVPKVSFCGFTTCLNEDNKYGIIVVHYMQPEEIYALFDAYVRTQIKIRQACSDLIF